MSRMIFAMLVSLGVLVTLVPGAAQSGALTVSPIPSAKPALPPETRWLALALYHEARGESDKGILAVAEVLLNRKDRPDFPPTIEEVVTQGGEELFSCQFTFWCDGKSDQMVGPDRERVVQLAKLALKRYRSSQTVPLLPCVAHSYHVSGHPMSNRVISYFERLQRAALIGEHVFYCDPDAGNLTS